MLEAKRICQTRNLEGLCHLVHEVHSQSWKYTQAIKLLLENITKDFKNPTKIVVIINFFVIHLQRLSVASGFTWKAIMRERYSSSVSQLIPLAILSLGAFIVESNPIERAEATVSSTSSARFESSPDSLAVTYNSTELLSQMVYNLVV